MQKTYIDKIALISLQNKKILMTKSKGKDRWFMPGGKRAEGESDEETLVREIKEECSVDIHPASIQYYGTFEEQAYGKPPGTMVRMQCYTASYFGTPQPSGEIIEIDFFSYDRKKETAPAAHLIFDDLKIKSLME